MVRTGQVNCIQAGVRKQQMISATQYTRKKNSIVRRLSVFLSAIAATLLLFVTSPQVLGQARELVEQFTADENSLKFKYRVPLSQATEDRFKEFYDLWRTRISQVDFDRLDQDGKIDLILLKNHIEYQKRRGKVLSRKISSVRRLAPYWETLVKMLEDHESMKEIDPEKIAAEFTKVTKKINGELEQQRIKLTGTLQTMIETKPTLVYEAAIEMEKLSSALSDFHKFYSGYDPMYSWWVKKPYEEVSVALSAHVKQLKKAVFGKDDPETKIVGQPIGVEALDLAIKNAMIPYTAAELIEIANIEMTWCDVEMGKATRALGFRDWKKAQEFVKTKHVAPGKQPKMISDLAHEAVRFLEMNNLITVPKLAKESWRMKMMSPARQKMSPYFLGGDTIIVSYPTDSMSHSDKLMSLRGNNVHFARATVHHELIPGHHLQFFMNARNKPYRKLFKTPFWLEGWAVYWEMLLWDLNFARSAEDRIGMLFWRKHRCARIIFSLAYHSGDMSPEDCIDYLVDRVGHERNNATAEVRRSIMGGYGPLYQAAYMLGAKQFRKLYAELVQSGKMTNREFHDAVLKENSIPIELLRAKLTNQELSLDFEPSWRFSGR